MELYPHQIQGLKETEDLDHVAIKGYEGLYEINTNGSVFSLVQNNSRRKRVLRPDATNGYLRVTLFDRAGKRKKHFIHRLVAEAFIPNPEGLPEVNHIDCDHKNNNVTNLEWCSRQQNLIHSYDHGLKRTCEKHGCSKLNWDAVHDIRNKALPQKAYAEKYGVSQSTVSAIQLNKLWREVI